MMGHVRQARAVKARLAGTPHRAPGEPAVRRRDRVRAKLVGRGRAAAAGWTRGRSDEELARRFGEGLAQRTVFSTFVKAFQPAMAFGFEGDIVVELRPLDDDGDPNASDWWTIEVRGRRATAHRGRSLTPAAVVHASVTNFIRLAAGELHSARALLEGLVVVDGDIMLAARLPDMFGAVPPTVSEAAAT
jgi:hypothetical protein